jgi:hypothetical protein
MLRNSKQPVLVCGPYASKPVGDRPFFNRSLSKRVGKAKWSSLQDLGHRLFAVGPYMGEVLRLGVGGEWIRITGTRRRG